MKKRYIFDTNIFDEFVKGDIDIIKMQENSELLTTHIQQDEIKQTSDPRKKQMLMKAFNLIHPQESQEILTESMVWDVSKWDKCKWGEDDYKPVNNELATESFILGKSRLSKAKLSNANIYTRLLKLLDEDKPHRHEQNIKDALIGETAIKNKITLVTKDQSLRTRVTELGGKAIDFETFKQETVI